MWSPTNPSTPIIIGKIRFQSTGSVWSPTESPKGVGTHRIISIHGLRVEPDGYTYIDNECIGISIHGLRVEPDFFNRQTRVKGAIISIHGLRVEPDFSVITRIQSLRYFNPRAPCGARQDCLRLLELGLLFQSTGSVWSPTPNDGEEVFICYISIHGLRVEPDNGYSN